MARSPTRSREAPRLSAAQLADYLVSTHVAQIGILRQAKYPQSGKPLIIQYQIARRAIAASLVAPSQRQRIIGATLADLEQRRDDPASSPLVRDDAERSLVVLEHFNATVNSLELGDYRFEQASERGSALTISGVEVNVAADAYVLVNHRTSQRVGEIFVRCAIGGKGENAENRRSDANEHLATIAHLHPSACLGDRGTPHSPTSLVLDVSRTKLVKGPASTIMRVRNIEAACSQIAAIWPTL